MLLPAAALQLLKALPRVEGGVHVFYASCGGRRSDMSLAAVMRHGGGCSASRFPVNIPRLVWRENALFARTRRALAHTLENKVEAAYRRGDALEKRREMMTAWAKFCAQKSTIKPVKSVSSPLED